MTTLGGNVTALGVDGKFDDCQAMVKSAFADPDLAGVRLTSANSINIARLLPQSVYYVYAYTRLADAAAGEPMVFSIPSGNFGDMMGAVLSWRMGLPIERLVIATNVNDEFPQYLQTGRYAKVVPSRAGLSNAMNVGHPSNLARLVHVYGGWMDPDGILRRPPDLEAMRRDLYAVSISDERTRRAIREAHASFGVLLEPHGAAAWAGLEDYSGEPSTDEGRPAVVLETAHPAKFPEEIRAILGIEPEPPASLSGLEGQTETFRTIPADYGSFFRLLRTLN
jgi:threonine synthase